MAPRMRTDPASCRDAVLAGRADAVSDADLVGLVMCEARPGIGRAVLEAHPRPDGLWRVGAEDLTALEGVGPAGAARFLACLELARRASAWPACERPVVSTPEDVVSLCSTQLRGLDREHFWALVLSTKNQLLRMVGGLGRVAQRVDRPPAGAVQGGGQDIGGLGGRRAQPPQRRPDAVAARISSSRDGSPRRERCSASSCWTTSSSATVASTLAARHGVL